MAAISYCAFRYYGGITVISTTTRKTKIPNLFRLMQIEDEISEALGIPVTITSPLDEGQHRAGRRSGRIMPKDPTIAIRDGLAEIAVLHESGSQGPENPD